MWLERQRPAEWAGPCSIPLTMRGACARILKADARMYGRISSKSMNYHGEGAPMSFTAEEFRELPHIISEPRFATYLQAREATARRHSPSMNGI